MDLRGDDRAVSSVVAVTLLLGFLVVALSLYQAAVVPAHNEEVEYKHSQRVQQDLVEVRNALLRTKVTGEDGYATVELGTEYPARIVALNPPAAGGTIRTTETKPIRVWNETGGDVSTIVCPGVPETRFLEYHPSYHEYANAPVTLYENSVIYKQFSTGNVAMSGQTLVRDDTINVIPLEARYFESGTGAATIEPKAGRLKTTELSNPTVRLPTRLGERDWERLLAGEVDPANVSVANGNLTLSPFGSFAINCGPVAVNEAPPSGARGGGGIEINPVAPGDVKLTDSQIQSGSAHDEIVEIDLNNTARRDTAIERARITFFFDEQVSGDNVTEAIIRNGTSATDSATLRIEGETRTLSPEIVLPGNETVTTIELDFDSSVTKSDFFIIDVTLESGETGTYFVAPGKY